MQRTGFKSRSGLNGVLNPGHFDIISQLLIRTFLTPETTNAIIHAFVTSNIDSCNCLLFGLPKFLLQRLKRVLYCAARVVYQSNRYDHSLRGRRNRGRGRGARKPRKNEGIGERGEGTPATRTPFDSFLRSLANANF